MSKIQASEALKPFRVLDLSRVRAGPNCVRTLTDFGADVIRIEPPEGVDPNEAMFAANRHGGDFQNLNRNKRSLTLNLKKPGALDIFMKLVETADVVVENWRPDVKTNWVWITSRLPKSIRALFWQVFLAMVKQAHTSIARVLIRSCRAWVA